MSVCKAETVLCRVGVPASHTSVGLPAPHTILALCRRCQCVKLRQCYVGLGCLYHTLYYSSFVQKMSVCKDETVLCSTTHYTSFVQKMSVCKAETVLCRVGVPASHTIL